MEAEPGWSIPQSLASGVGKVAGCTGRKCRGSLTRTPPYSTGGSAVSMTARRLQFMKMPAQSVRQKAEATRDLDTIAIPLIPQLGIAGAYQKALADCDTAARDRFPVAARVNPTFGRLNTQR